MNAGRVSSRVPVLCSPAETADTMLSKTTHKITIRYNPDIDYSCWIMYAGRRFDIDYINDPHLDKRYLELFVQEVIG